MHLKSLSLLNFKNFESLDLELCHKMNCFIGDNGIGKTNILDSIYYLSFCKSAINQSDKQNIKQDEEFFVIQGEFFREGENEKIYCGFQKDKKKSFRRNNVEYQRLSEHIGFIPIVFSTPYDSNLIHLGSEVRRKFVDSIISQFNKNYLNDLMAYNQTLEQRNSLLKKASKNPKFDYDEIEIWDIQLVKKGIEIYNVRKIFANEIKPIFQDYYNKISQYKTTENVELIYNTQLIDEDFALLLKKNFEKDKFLQYTSAGIHKDDFEFLLNNNLIKRYASHGQQKTYTISLKFAQYDYIKNKINFNPILLLDDIFDKLDKKRVKMITQLVANDNFGQIFMTDTSHTRLPEIVENLNIEYKIFNL